MKKLIILLFALMVVTPIFAQEKQLNIPQSASEPVEGASYKLFPTSNMWSFLKLDTRNGRIWRVQFSVKGSDYRYEESISSEKRVYLEQDEKPGRFTLYATENIYNFLLLDQIDGRCWQVQWGDNPMVIRIY